MWRRATGGGGGGGGGAGWPGLVPRCPWVDAKACVVVVVDFTESNATLFSLGYSDSRVWEPEERQVCRYVAPSVPFLV